MTGAVQCLYSGRRTRPLIKKNYFGIRGGGGIVAIVTWNVVFVVNMKISFSPLPWNMHSR